MTKNPHDHLHGLSPRARNKHNLNVISEYLFRVGYSTPELMKSLIGNQDTGWFTDAIKRKDFQKVSTGVYEPSFIMALMASMFIADPSVQIPRPGTPRMPGDHGY